jgi:hypothetical protein
LHGNFAWHRDRALAVLGCRTDDDPDAVRDAVAHWRTVELEQALADAGAVGFAVRTAGEWQASAPGAAVAGLPLVARSTADESRRPLPTGRFAEGVRVLDLTRVIAGPVATRALAAWGADVLRLDPPWLAEPAAQTVDMLSGKHSAFVDLAEPGGRELLEQLLSAADVVVQGYRPGALARFGLDPVDLAGRHPHLVTVTLSAWGAAGPWSGRRGFDSVVQGPTGIAVTEGDGSRPGALPAQVLDHATGYLAAAAALTALAAVARGAPPVHARLSLAQTAHWLSTAAPKPTPIARPEPPQVPVDRYLVRLSGAGRTALVVAPPGRVGDRTPSWRATTVLGADPPAFTPSV